MYFKLIFFSLFLIFTFTIAGCDNRPRRVPVSGRVLIDGKPLSKGVIQVFPAHDRMAGSEIRDGQFTLFTYEENDGCVLGKHPVAVIGRETRSPMTFLWLAPKKYIDPTTSGLEIDVPGPRNDVEIRLTWGGGKPFIESVNN